MAVEQKFWCLQIFFNSRYWLQKFKKS